MPAAGYRRYLIRPLVVLLLFAFVAAYGRAGGNVEIVEYPQPGPPETPGIVTIAQVSDLHIGSGVWPIHRRAARALEEIDPDILLLTGDAVDMGDAAGYLEEWLDDLRLDRARKFAVLGNWEYLVGFEPGMLRSLYAAHDFTLLVNESRDVALPGGFVRVTGLDDLLFGDPDYDAVGGGAGDENYPEIVMIHEPVMADQLVGGTNRKILFAGHTHGGQVKLGKRPIYLPPGCGDYVAGHYAVGGNDLYVSKGIGMSTVNLRLGAVPDIIVFRLEPMVVSSHG